jgi:ATP-dependent DNA helicase DinG
VNYTTKTPLSDFFSSSGLLARRFEGYEHRPQQAELALAVRDFLLDPVQSTMAAEAPPGVGKTFAGLIPSILLALEQGNHILFLTAGIALQEQLIGKDLPKLRSLLGKGFTYGLLKGRSNYACLRRAFALQGIYFAGLTGTEGDAPLDLPRWLEETESGDLSELSLPAGHPLLFQASAGARGCLGTACPFKGRCFVTQAFREAQDWQVVVANYHLFFSHILGGKGSFPVRYDWLVCDEAHRISDAARNAAAVEAGSEDGAALLRPRTLAGFESLLGREGLDTSLFRERAEACRNAQSALFALAELRYRQGEGIAECSEDVLRKGEELADSLETLVRPLHRIEDRFSSGGFENDAGLGEAGALMNWLDDLREYSRAVSWCLKVEKFPNWGYWRGTNALMSAPVVCADIVRNALESEGPEKNIFISATLSMAGDFSFWTRETGVQPDKTLVVNSPFDYANRMELLVVDIGMPVGARGYDDKICRVIQHLCDENNGRTLVLLSSLRLLRALAGRMRSRSSDYEVLVQGDEPQRDLLRRFREVESSVLLGSVSFREGVDIPGEGLTQVIIDRIPFSHPNDPMVHARNILEGRESFVKTALPSAKMFLRQATGRLLRTSSDHGRVALLDSRVLDRREWKILESLPPCKYRRLSVKE